jgi:hypothetical protein
LYAGDTVLGEVSTSGILSVRGTRLTIEPLAMGNNPSLLFQGVQQVSGNLQSTSIYQQCGEGQRALTFTPNHGSPSVSDILYRFQNNTGTSEIRINNEMQLSMNNGTVSRPSLSFQSSTNSGLFWSTTSPSSMVVSIGAAERARFSENGLRIGTSTAVGTNTMCLQHGFTLIYTDAPGDRTSSLVFSNSSTITNARVLVSIMNSNTSTDTTRMIVSAKNVTSTGFDIHLYRPSGSTPLFVQIAYIVIA